MTEPRGGELVPHSPDTTSAAPIVLSPGAATRDRGVSIDALARAARQYVDDVEARMSPGIDPSTVVWAYRGEVVGGE